MIISKATFAILTTTSIILSSHFIHAFSPCPNTCKLSTSPSRLISLRSYYGIPSQNTQLYGYIEADSVDEQLDPKAGGIGLAMDNAITISGSVDSKGNAVPKELKHYSQVIPLDIISASQDMGPKILCTGEGVEIYKDPGETTIRSITLAPISAVENALADVSQGQVEMKSGDKLFITFAGGDDLMVHEVLEGVEKMVKGLSNVASSGNRVEFRSLCEPSFPMEKCGVAAVIVGKESNGQFYYNEGKWYTVSEDDFVDASD